MRTETVGLKVASDLFAVPYQTADDWFPLLHEAGRREGRRRVLTFMGLLCFEVCRALRIKGLTMDAVRPVIDWLASQSEAGLDASFAAGRTHIVLGDGKVVGPVAPGFVLQNAGPKPLIHVAVIDLARVVDKLKRRLAELRAHQAKS